MASLLDQDFGPQEDTETLLHSLLLEEEIRKNLGGGTSASSLPSQTAPQGLSIRPEAALCIKTVTEAEEKVFINICTSDKVPRPPEVTDEELLVIVESGDAIGYRIPMSIGQPHAELDHAGKGCTAYDVVVNDAFLTSAQERPVLLNFLFTLTLEALEQKYSSLLSRECRILKNRKAMGSIQEQFVRQTHKPAILEVNSDSGTSDQQGKSPLISEVKDHVSVVPEPEYSILRDPPEGKVEHLVMEVRMPKVKASSGIVLSVGEDRVVLDTRPRVYRLDIDLPFLINMDEVGSQFNRTTKVLNVTLPVLGPALY